MENKKYIPISILDPKSPDYTKRSIEEGQIIIDPKIKQALLEVCAKNVVPLPDRVIEGEVVVNESGNMYLQYGPQNLWYKDQDRDGKSFYVLQCTAPDGGVACNLTFNPTKKVTRQGHNGVVKVGRNRETMFYYFIPRGDVQGTIQIGEECFEVTGSGWYDHEFGGLIWDNSVHGAKSIKTHDESDYAWNWFSAQLNNGMEITATNLVDPYKKVTFDNYAVILGRERLEYESSRLEPIENWRSCRSYFEYPTEWRLTVPDIDLDLNIKAEMQDQEFLTMIARPAFWEGRVIVSGKIGAEQVNGFGFVEVYGHDDLRCMNKVLKNVGKTVIEEIERTVPLHPNDSQLAELIGGEDFVDGFGTDVFKSKVLQPIRDITDRGGKSWRSCALLFCIDAVGGDSRRWRNWLGVPELVHTGSLIVDDVQDKSLIRRGGPSVHLMYGEPLAINAGSAAYFLISMFKFPENTPEQTKVKIYDLYFQGLRSGHAGQALDIYGLNYIMDEVVQSGNGKKLEKMVMAIHKLKSAAPAASVAKTGAIVGNGSDDQVEKFGKYFEALGVAFQIFDDVLNLRGFEGNLKDRGEDLAQGKVTYPVAKAMSRLSSVHQREWLWNTIKSKPQDRSVVESCIDLIEECGGLSEAASEGMQMMETAWNELDACIPDSYAKMMLRSLSYYLLDRMY